MSKNKYINKIPEGVTRCWTPQSKYCYELKCNCLKCNIYKWLETECLMKYTVIELYKLYGKPPKSFSNLPKKFRDEEYLSEPKLTKEFILDNLHNGKSLNDIAKDTGFSLYTVSRWSKKVYCINARYEKGVKSDL